MSPRGGGGEMSPKQRWKKLWERERYREEFGEENVQGNLWRLYGQNLITVSSIYCKNCAGFCNGETRWLPFPSVCLVPKTNPENGLEWPIFLPILANERRGHTILKKDEKWQKMPASTKDKCNFSLMGNQWGSCLNAAIQGVYEPHVTTCDHSECHMQRHT